MAILNIINGRLPHAAMEIMFFSYLDELICTCYIMELTRVNVILKQISLNLNEILFTLYMPDEGIS